MPFDKPSQGGSILECEDGRYLVKVKSLDDTESAEYGPGIKWTLNVATTDKQMLKDERGFDAELWQFSSTKLTPRAKARKWTEAFLGREIDDDSDDGPTLMTELLGKWAIAILAHNDKDRVSIVTLSPLKAAAKAPAKEPVLAGVRSSGAASSPDEPPDELLAVDTASEIPTV